MRVISTVIFIALSVIAIGLFWPNLNQLGMGSLPGDMVIRSGDFTLYAPLATALILSAIISFVAWLARR